MSLVRDLVAVCERDWLLFGRQEIDRDAATIRRGMQETDERFWQRVGDYRREAVGRKPTGRDTDLPCSAAFVSWAVRQAGGEVRFPASASHSRYIRRPIRDRRREVADVPPRGFRPAERAPAVGDPICCAREFGIDSDRQPTTYKSHADVVVATAPGEVAAIGGNVGNSVAKRQLRADAVGRATDRRQAWFAVPENRL